MSVVANAEKLDKTKSVKLSESDLSLFRRAERAVMPRDAEPLSESALIRMMARIGAQRLLEEKGISR